MTPAYDDATAQSFCTDILLARITTMYQYTLLLGILARGVVVSSVAQLRVRPIGVVFWS